MSSNIKICIAGATGTVGRCLVRAICESPDFQLVGAVSRTHKNQELGRVLSDCPTQAHRLLISGSVAQALKVPTDVLIDYTRPDAARENVSEAILNGVHVVIGTSGLVNDDYTFMDTLAREKRIGVIAASNFALTIGLLQFCASHIAKHIPHFEIIDYASPSVTMSPLGTTREIAHRLSEHQIHSQGCETSIGDSSRGHVIDGTPVHSLRLPGYLSCIEVTFGMGDEQLVLRHTCNSPASYVAGTLLAVRKVSNYVGLIRGLDRIMDFS